MSGTFPYMAISMITFLISILAFMLAIGILVAIHEFGHYWVARKVGIKVLRFSVGFGKPLWTHIGGKDKTEYVLAAIPLGGYVKMLDEREGDVAEGELHRAFNRQSVWKRIAVVVAGPVANFLLAIVLYTLVFILGTKAVQPFVGEITPNSPAAIAGMSDGGQITAINGGEVNSWTETRMSFLNAYLENNKRVDIRVTTVDSDDKVYSLDLSEVSLLKDSDDFLEKSGIFSWQPLQVVSIAEVLPDSAAKASGLQKNDVVLQVDEISVKDRYGFIKYIQAHPKQDIDLLIGRNGEQLPLLVTLGEKESNGKLIGSLGAALGSKISDDITSENRRKLESMGFIYQRGFADSFVLGIKKTWQMSVVTLKVMGRLIIGEASLKNISGPVTIAEFAGKTALMGLTVYLGFLAIISVSLGVLNLLPIPMLDGGHLLYYIIELFRGKPVSEQVEAFGFRIGITLVGSMMMLALYNDISRLMT